VKLRRDYFEWFIFIGIVVAFLFPVWFLPQLISLDGGVHIYNSRLVKNMLLNANHWGYNYYDFTSFPIPNWFGHGLSIVMLFFMDSIWAMKIQLLALMSTFILSWRWVLVRANIQNIWASHFGILLMWSWFIFLGFHNFLWGLNFSLILMAVSLKTPSSYKTLVIKYFALWGLIYFSHPTLFIIALVWIGFYRIFQLFSTRKEKTQGINGILSLIVSASPWVALTVAFVFTRNSDLVSNVYLPLSKKLEMIKEFNPLLLFDGNFETPLIHYVFVTLAVLLFISFFRKKNRKTVIKGEKETNKPFVLATAFIATACILGFFILPDSTDTGSFIGVRMLYLSLLFGFILLTYFIRSSYIFIFGYLVFIGIQVNRINYYTKAYKSNSEVLEQLVEWGRELEAGSVVVGINEGPWFFENLEMQLSADNDVVCIENFEASTGYFPLFWKKGMYPVPAPEQQLFNHKGELLEEVDYVLWIRGNSDQRPKLKAGSLKLIKSKESYFLFRWLPYVK
jgi:hypothetical protein